MKDITLSNSTKVALIDDADFEWLSGFRWELSATGYAVRRPVVGGKRRNVRMHREIMQAPPEFEVDHINGNKLDNRRANLRLATKSQNQANACRRRNNSSGFKGVSKDGNRWKAAIGVGGSMKYLGLFRSRKEAAEVYDLAAQLLQGPFARLNLCDALMVPKPEAISVDELLADFANAVRSGRVVRNPPIVFRCHDDRPYGKVEQEGKNICYAEIALEN